MITNYIIKATPNKKNRTFTIRQYNKTELISKYRTFKMTKQEFNSNLHNTLNDWRYYLKSDDYYRIR
jgi:hypothetical protein